MLPAHFDDPATSLPSSGSKQNSPMETDYLLETDVPVGRGFPLETNARDAGRDLPLETDFPVGTDFPLEPDLRTDPEDVSCSDPLIEIDRDLV